MYTWLAIDSIDDVAGLAGHVEDDYNPPVVIKMLREELTAEVKGILVETLYVDKDYRSTFYSFYAKKGLRYSPFCVRLHFWKAGVALTADLDLQSAGRLEDAYVGYMVLRPTPITPVGRTVLSIHAKKSVDGAIIEGTHHVHLLGYRFEVKGFPYMQQHTDISVCAHAACWSILRHYTQQHRRYAEFLLTDITQMASPTNPGGLIPSRGLRIDQACRIFSHAGLFPDVYEKAEFPQNFYRLLNAYVESGFPVFVAMSGRGHAITVIGHGRPDRQAFAGSADPVLYAWEAVNSLIVVDDNYMPYRVIDSLNATPYKVTDIDAFIVPLPEKIYYPAEAVEERVADLLTHSFPQLDWSYLQQPVVRYFVTTSARFRNYIRDQKSALPQPLFELAMNLCLPQFVWVVQIAARSEWQQQRCNVTFLLDATASALDEEPFFLLHDRQRVFAYDRGDRKVKGWVDFGARPLDAMSEFRKNLSYRH